jgi:hypothetical protein
MVGKLHSRAGTQIMINRSPTVGAALHRNAGRVRKPKGPMWKQRGKIQKAPTPNPALELRPPLTHRDRAAHIARERHREPCGAAGKRLIGQPRDQHFVRDILTAIALISRPGICLIAECWIS